MDSKAFIKYISALLLFGLNGIVASHIPLNSYEIVFLRTLIGSILLIALFLIGKGKFRIKAYERDALSLFCPVLQWERVGCSFTKHINK